MAKLEGEVADQLLPKEAQPSTKDCEQKPYLVVPFRSRNARSHITVCCIFYHANLIILVVLLFLIAVGLVLWPSHPEIEVVHVHLNHMNISRSKDTIMFLDTSMDIKVRIRNQDFVPHNYNLVSIFIGYHGKRLGSTTRSAVFVSPRSMSYVEATIKLSGNQDHGGWLEQHDGKISGHVPLEIAAEVGSTFHFFSINIPIQGKISCSVNVDIATQAIAKQDCYTE